MAAVTMQQGDATCALHSMACLFAAVLLALAARGARAACSGGNIVTFDGCATTGDVVITCAVELSSLEAKQV